MDIREVIDYIKDKYKYCGNDCNGLYVEECKEAKEMAISALEKQIAKKPYRETVHRRTGYTTMEIIDTYTCECHNTVNESYRYCSFCGQAIKW